MVGLTYDTSAKMAKELGATKMGSVAYSVSPPSTAPAESTQKYAAPAQDLEPVYLNTTPSSAPRTRRAHRARTKNPAPMLYLPLDSDTNFAIVQGLQRTAWR